MLTRTKHIFETYMPATYEPSAKVTPPEIDLSMGPDFGGRLCSALEHALWIETPWESVSVSLGTDGRITVLWRRRLTLSRTSREEE